MDFTAIGFGFTGSADNERPQEYSWLTTILLSTKIYVHNLWHLYFFQVWIHFLLYLCDFINVLHRHFTVGVMSGQRSELLNPWSFVKEPWSLWWFDYELESPVGVCCEFDFEWYIASDVGCEFVKLFTEFHHVNAQGAEAWPILGLGLATPAKTLKLTVATNINDFNTSIWHISNLTKKFLSIYNVSTFIYFSKL